MSRHLEGVVVWVLPDGVAAGSGDGTNEAFHDAVLRTIDSHPANLPERVRDLLDGSPLRIDGDADAIAALLREVRL